MEENITKLKSKVISTSIKELDKTISWAVNTQLSVLKPKAILLVRGNKGRTYDAFYPKKRRLSLLSDEPLFIYLRLHPRVLISKEIPCLLKDNLQNRQLLKKIELILKGLNTDVVVPLFLNNQIYGIFLLSSIKLNRSFIKDDFDILRKFQASVSNALIGAILYKEAIERIVYGKF